MSMMYCEHHDWFYDTDIVTECPYCLEDELEKESNSEQGSDTQLQGGQE